MSALERAVRSTVERIRSLEPVSVLEIGAGTGNLAIQLAPFVGAYVASDASPNAIERLRFRVENVGYKNVQAFCLEALRAGEIAAEFDVVVINSVAQYFPDQQYATEVLDLAWSLIKGSGSVFVGDVRHALLRVTEHFLVTADVSATDEEIIDGTLLHLARDRELCLAPSFFQEWAGSHGQIAVPLLQTALTGLSVAPFRYDVIISSKPGRIGQPESAIECHHPLADRLTEEHLGTDRPLWLRGVPNEQIVQSLRPWGRTHPEVLDRLGIPRPVHGEPPPAYERLEKLASRRTYRVWESDRADGQFSVYVDTPAIPHHLFDPAATLRSALSRQMEIAPVHDSSPGTGSRGSRAGPECRPRPH